MIPYQQVYSLKQDKIAVCREINTKAQTTWSQGFLKNFASISVLEASGEGFVRAADRGHTWITELGLEHAFDKGA